MENNTVIPGSCARRLPKYFRCLRGMLINGIMRVNSAELADNLGITPSQVRSDLSRIGEMGQQGYGYSVKLLYTEISRILGAGDNMTAVIIGGSAAAGKILAERFEGRGVGVTSFFGDDPSGDELPVHGDILYFGYENIAQRLAQCPADIAVILDLPQECGDIAALLPEYGIRGVWNMTQNDIFLPIPVVNLPLGDVIMGLCYEIRNIKNTEAER